MDNKKKILVVEDEKAMARALEAKLLRSGYEVTIAENGDQALLLLKNDAYNLIILDLMMPKKILKRHWRSILLMLLLRLI